MRLPKELFQRVLAGTLCPGEVLDEVRKYAPESAKNNRYHPWWSVVGVEFFDAIEQFAAGRPGEQLTVTGFIFLSPIEAVRQAFMHRGKVVVDWICGDRIFRVLPIARADELVTEKLVARAMPAEMVEPSWDEDLPRLDRFRQLAERQYLRRLVEKHGWNLSSAAREAGVARQTLYALLVRRGLQRPEVPEPIAQLAAQLG